MFIIFDRNIANYYPNLLASMIVRSYHTSLPGEISRKWKSSSGIFTNLFLNQVPTTRRVRHFTFTSILFTLLQQLGSISPSIQRIILHILQPLILSALYFISVILRDHPYSLIGVGISIDPEHIF